jgi:hypothetical protein
LHSFLSFGYVCHSQNTWNNANTGHFSKLHGKSLMTDQTI